MAKYNYISDYKHDNSLRLSFNSLAQKTFGIDFEYWYQKGFWNEKYVCHSMQYEGQIISNVSISKIDLLIDNKEVKAIQIGTVFTHPDFRLQGLLRILIDNIHEIYGKDYDLFYLFPNESVMNFYPKFGYSPSNDVIFSSRFTNLSGSGKKYRKIDINQECDLHKLHTIISSRIPRSNHFDCLHSNSIFLWYCLNIFKDNIYILEPQNIIVIFEENETAINLYDVVLNQPANLHDILNRITCGNDKKVVFHFTPDFADIDISELSVSRNEEMFVKPHGFLPECSFAYPIMAHT